MFQIFHDFWIEQLPMFQENFEIFYIIMDFLTVIVFLKLLFEIGSIGFGGHR